MIDRVDIVARAAHQAAFAAALLAGLARHGITGRVVEDVARVQTPVAACWGWRAGAALRARGATVLVGERGYIGDRMAWTSLGWNGLNGRAVFPPAGDSGRRFDDRFRALMLPWSAASRRQAGEGGTAQPYALILGQVTGDAAVAHVDLGAWIAAAAAALRARGYDVRFRPHPLSHARPPHIRLADGSLADALARAAVAVTFNSNSGVDAALAGVPVIACDPGSMARPVAAPGLDDALVTPDRGPWAARLAWCQWSEAEIRDGTALAHVLPVMPAA